MVCQANSLQYLELFQRHTQQGINLLSVLSIIFICFNICQNIIINRRWKIINFYGLENIISTIPSIPSISVQYFLYQKWTQVQHWFLRFESAQ